MPAIQTLKVKIDQVLHDENKEVRVLYDTIPIQYAVVCVMLMSYFSSLTLLAAYFAFFAQGMNGEVAPELSYVHVIPHVVYLGIVLLAFTALDRNAKARSARLVPLFLLEVLWLMMYIILWIGFTAWYLRQPLHSYTAEKGRKPLSIESYFTIFGILLLLFVTAITIQYSIVAVLFRYIKYVYNYKAEQRNVHVELVNRAIDEVNQIADSVQRNGPFAVSTEGGAPGQISARNAFNV